MSDDTTALERLEQQRCAALMAGNADALSDILADDLVHIHLNGQTDTKSGYLDGVRSKYGFRQLERGSLTVRFFADVAVMTGTLSQTLVVLATGDVMNVRAMTTQVWHRDGDRFLLNTCHNAPLPRS